MSLLAPEALSLLFLLGFLLLGLHRRRPKARLPHPLVPLLREAAREARGPLPWLPTLLFALGLLLLALAAARPLLPLPGRGGGGVAILVVDVSRSMMATDLRPNRLEAAKEAARTFLQEAPPGVRIGLVAFSGFAQTLQPPTRDRPRLLQSLESLEFGRSTAIGEGLLEALRLIREAGGRGEILLLTDGRNRTGADPLEAAAEAARMGVRIFAVGVGVPGWTPGPEDPVSGLGFLAGAFELDEELLWSLAAFTGGQYYLVTSEGDLSALYRELAQGLRLEARTAEATGPLGLLGGFLALLGLTVRRYLSPA
ncbi:vWA domain-containing protein [Thermus thermamylovorans]|uniref:VWA domain-containing protein n=1 Tax=Thermus thermamylovorans TaxID=2509362 RepID=A0A4Q9B315_9DEIN|nr:VWA domain-containing protein [Thermus thermamylovorans]TBH20041.1 VWA domain-containing protein [Thermus thermamylovorans]